MTVVFGLKIEMAGFVNICTGTCNVAKTFANYYEISFYFAKI